MRDKPTVQFTFAVNDAELEDAKRQEIARKLLLKISDFFKDFLLRQIPRSLAISSFPIPGTIDFGFWIGVLINL